MIQAVQYLICGILWMASSVLTIWKKNPIGIIILALMHGAEAVIIGIKTGLKYGKKLPYSIGGGIGQSRICMFFLQRAHIGEVQSSMWPEDVVKTAKENGINLL